MKRSISELGKILNFLFSMHIYITKVSLTFGLVYRQTSGLRELLKNIHKVDGCGLTPFKQKKVICKAQIDDARVFTFKVKIKIWNMLQSLQDYVEVLHYYTKD